MSQNDLAAQLILRLAFLVHSVGKIAGDAFKRGRCTNPALGRLNRRESHVSPRAFALLQSMAKAERLILR